MNAVTIVTSGPEASERDDQTGQEEQMVDPVEDVLEAEDHEPERRLMPAGIERDDTGVATELERAFGAVRRDEAKHRDDAQTETLDTRQHRELRPRRGDRILENHVEHRLLPCQVRVQR